MPQLAVSLRLMSPLQLLLQLNLVLLPVPVLLAVCHQLHHHHLLPLLLFLLSLVHLLLQLKLILRRPRLGL